MPHFLIKKEQINNDFIVLANGDENFFHITRVLRIKTGEKIKFIDDDKIVYYCTMAEIEKKILKAKIISKEKSSRVLKNDICLVQSILMTDAQNLAIANATQSGVREIYPVISDNVSVKKSSLKGKEEKWQKIVLENFKQCERADLAEIKEIQELKEVLKTFKKENILIFAEKDENISLDLAVKDIDKSAKIAVVIGPEGGFSEDEFNYFKKENYKLISLGNMIYKAPNAIVAGVSNVVSRIENV